MALSNDFYQLSGIGNELEIRSLLLSEIVVKDQIRKEFTDIEELAASIKELGLQNPLVIIKREFEFVLNQGERRYRALSLLVEQGFTDFERVACHIIEFDNAEKEFMRQFSENFSRSDLTALEYADAISYYNDNFDDERGWKTRFAKKYGVSKPFVSRHIKLCESSNAVKKLCSDGFVTDVNRLLQISDHPMQAELIESLRSGMSYKDAVELLANNAKSLDDGSDSSADDGTDSDTSNETKPSKNESPTLSKKHLDALVKYVMAENGITDIETLISFIDSQ